MVSAITEILALLYEIFAIECYNYRNAVLTLGISGMQYYYFRIAGIAVGNIWKEMQLIQECWHNTRNI